jgi:hypothetical protein
MRGSINVIPHFDLCKYYTGKVSPVDIPELSLISIL